MCYYTDMPFINAGIFEYTNFDLTQLIILIKMELLGVLFLKCVHLTIIQMSLFLNFFQLFIASQLWLFTERVGLTGGVIAAIAVGAAVGTAIIVSFISSSFLLYILESFAQPLEWYD